MPRAGEVRAKPAVFSSSFGVLLCRAQSSPRLLGLCWGIAGCELGPDVSHQAVGGCHCPTEPVPFSWLFPVMGCTRGGGGGCCHVLPAAKKPRGFLSLRGLLQRNFFFAKKEHRFLPSFPPPRLPPAQMQQVSCFHPFVLTQQSLCFLKAVWGSAWRGGGDRSN